MPSSTTLPNPDVALALTPLHLAQIICLSDPSRPTWVIARHARSWERLLETRPDLVFRPLDVRESLLAAVTSARQPFDALHAVPWNRFALRLERAALKSGGAVTVIEDGIGNYRPPKPLGGRERLLALAFSVLDRTIYAEHPAARPERPGLRLVSMIPERSAAGLRAEQLDPGPLRTLIPAVAHHFAAFRALRGCPVFFDTNDATSGWIGRDRKIEILRELLPRERIVYFRHPFQSESMEGAIDGLIDMTAEAHGWAEMACAVMQPAVVYSTFSSAILALRHLFGLPVAHATFHTEFFARTGHPGYRVESAQAAVIA